MFRALCAVALLAMACLLIRSARVGLAGDYVDPIGKVSAQDEALYSNSAIHMARQGYWLTPYFMGRLALYKPPVLMWVSGFSARLLGVSRLSLRLPVALIASLGLGLVFLWVAELRSWQAGACAALLIASDHLWHVLGGLCMTDGLLIAFYIAAMYCLFSDPWLESRWAFWGFAASVAAAILTKSVAGLLPLGVLGLYWIAAPRKERPSFLRVCLAGVASLALASPWFAYQAMVHSRWFWTEHIYLELFAFGAGKPPQTSQENQAIFYLRRLPVLDPVLLAFALVAVPTWIGDLRRRSGHAVLLACWMASVIGAILLFQYRNISYIFPIVPALAILAAAYGPYTGRRTVQWMLLFASLAFVGKAAFPTAPWGLSFQRGTIQPVAPLVSDYCERRRGHELILVGMDDDLYATTLPLSRLRYSLVGATIAGGKYAMPFDEMGIVLTAAQFNDVDRLRPAFRDRLREWGIDSDEPIGTLITPANPAELASIVAAHPDSDFLIPERYRAGIAAAAQPGHLLIDAPGHVFLLSRHDTPAAPLAWSCAL